MEVGLGDFAGVTRAGLTALRVHVAAVGSCRRAGGVLLERLHAYLNGEDQERARTVANRILADRVMINEIVGDPASPFGGFKMSACGREFAISGLQAYLEASTDYAS